ncbi:MAG: DegT/DnrJ/EryC1/StrS family aminotransferase [Deltaproteobacteria bacterium]|nr:DegT/DnrJ/EryC1/StrS family aminotransferase [Deltaproteobacteria bacterium]
MKIPFVDLLAQYRAHQAEIDGALRDVIESTAFIGGRFVKEFEESYAREYGIKHCVSVANGTDAIYIVLRMLGIGPGDEVITTAHSWFSTAETIGQTGATPVFVDVDEFYNIDPARIEAAITPRTRAMIPVHLYGQAARMEQIQEICLRRGLQLIEDCAQAHFATHAGKRVGTFGVAATFSFYPGKNLGAYGDAGAIITGDDELATRFRMYANHGQLKKHEHQIEGVNSRLDGLQAALLSKKLPHIHDWTRRRQAVAELYRQQLAGFEPVTVPECAPGSTHVYHLYVVRVPNREPLREFLRDRGIETGVHYPTALPFLTAYRARNHQPQEFPRAHHNQDTILSLPIYPEMTEEMVTYVVEAIRAFYGK